MIALLVAAVVALAFANGANDNSKGVATLAGSGHMGLGAAVLAGTAATAAGAVLSATLAGRLVAAFSGKGLVPAQVLTPAFLAAVAAGAALTVLLATWRGLPVSTTHAIVGGLVGAGLVASPGGLDLGRLAGVFLLPLLAGPLLAVPAGWLLHRAGAAAMPSLPEDACACEMLEPLAGAGSGGVASLRIVLGTERSCPHERRVLGISLARARVAAHLASATLLSAARGLNDTPKIVGLMAGAGAMGVGSGALLVAAAMAVGGALASRRVGRLMAGEIAELDPGRGLSGNLAASALVFGASRLGVPVSTTHVTTGGIAGAGAGLRRDTAVSVLLAWGATLPVGALLAGTAYALIG